MLQEAQATRSAHGKEAFYRPCLQGQICANKCPCLISASRPCPGLGCAWATPRSCLRMPLPPQLEPGPTTGQRQRACVHVRVLPPAMFRHSCHAQIRVYGGDVRNPVTPFWQMPPQKPQSSVDAAHGEFTRCRNTISSSFPKHLSGRRHCRGSYQCTLITASYSSTTHRTVQLVC